MRHNIEQHEDGEQGDPLMPMLFSLGVHNALEEVQQFLDPGEFLFAYLDDVFILSSPGRAREIFNLLENTSLREPAFAQWQNTCLECLWRATSRYRRSWRRRVEPEWCDDPGNSFGQWRVSVEDRGRTADGGAQIVGIHPLDPRFALRLADAHPMRRTSLPSSVAHRLSPA